MKECRRLPVRGDPVRWPTVEVTRRRVMTSTAAWRGLSLISSSHSRCQLPTYHTRRVRGVGTKHQ